MATVPELLTVCWLAVCARSVSPDADVAAACERLVRSRGAADGGPAASRRSRSWATTATCCRLCRSERPVGRDLRDSRSPDEQHSGPSGVSSTTSVEQAPAHRWRPRRQLSASKIVKRHSRWRRPIVRPAAMSRSASASATSSSGVTGFTGEPDQAPPRRSSSAAAPLAPCPRARRGRA